MKCGAALNLILSSTLWLFLAPVGLAGSTSDEVWDTKAAPILDRHCSKCHAGVRQKSGLDLRSLETILRGGERGPAIIPGKPDESRIIQLVLPGADPHMPVEGKKQLSSQEIETLREWIRGLPKSKSALASGNSTNNTWVSEYLADLRERERPRMKVGGNIPIQKAIDTILSADWRDAKIVPAKLCDDRTFARRIYLDLAGRIPAPDELKHFLNDPARNRREKLIDQLLESPNYSRRMRDVFDVVLLGRPRRNNDNARRDNGWHSYLENSFRTNRPWNEMVSDIILARGSTNAARGASWFLYEKRNNFQAMAEAIAPVAFGVQMQCAQCHNHPLAWEIEQRHYWGLVAAFNRSKNVETSPTLGLSESAIGGFVQFTNLKKESQPAVLAFPNGKIVEEKRPRENEKEIDNPNLYLVAPAKEGQKTNVAALPKFSRRAALADAATHDNPLLARAFVNRVWQIMLGRGIVHPVDQLDSRHRPSHPLLLDWLAKDFERNGYDVKRLVRGVVLSRAYQLEAKAPGKTPPAVTSFARAVDKPLTAEQLLDSLLIATGNVDPNAGKKNVADFDELRRLLLKRFPDFMPAVYNPTMEQALFWSNSPMLDDLLKPQNDNTMAKLISIQSPRACVDEAFSIVFGRLPNSDERKQFCDAMGSSTTKSGVKNLLWALITSAEFQLNH